MPSGQGDEDVFEAHLAGIEADHRLTELLKTVDEGRDGQVRLMNREGVAVGLDPAFADGGEVGEGFGDQIGAVAECELDDVLAAEPGDQIGGGAEGDDLSLVDDGDAVAKAFGLIHVVSGKDGRAAPALEISDDVPELAAGLRIEAGGRLVEEEEFRITDQSERDREPALLAAGERFDVGVCLGFKSHSGQDLKGIFPLVVKAAEEPNQFENGRFFGESGFLESDADAFTEFLGLGVPAAAEQFDVALGGGVEALENFDRGGFAGAVRAEQSKTLAGSDFQVEPIDGDHWSSAAWIDFPQTSNANGKSSGG